MWCVCHCVMSCQFLKLGWYFCCLGRFLWLLCTFFVLLGIVWSMPPGPSHHLWALAQLQGFFCEELLFAWWYVGSKLPSVIKAISCLMSEFTDIWAVYKPFSIAVRFYYQHQFSSPAQTFDNLSKHFWSCLCICLGFHSCTWKPKWKAIAVCMSGLVILQVFSSFATIWSNNCALFSDNFLCSCSHQTNCLLLAYFSCLECPWAFPFVFCSFNHTLLVCFTFCSVIDSYP